MLLQSWLQIAIFVLPFIVLAGWVTGQTFSLALDPVSVIILTLSGELLDLCSNIAQRFEALAVMERVPLFCSTTHGRCRHCIRECACGTLKLCLLSAVIHATFVSIDGSSNWLLGVQLVSLSSATNTRKCLRTQLLADSCTEISMRPYRVQKIKHSMHIIGVSCTGWDIRPHCHPGE